MLKSIYLVRDAGRKCITWFDNKETAKKHCTMLNLVERLELIFRAMKPKTLFGSIPVEYSFEKALEWVNEGVPSYYIEEVETWVDD